jgi:Cu+-exporting ATPase
MTNTVHDPVCGMEIDPKTAFASREHEGQTFYFCSQDCLDKFDADPHQYGHPEKHEHKPE